MTPKWLSTSVRHVYDEVIKVREATERVWFGMGGPNTSPRGEVKRQGKGGTRVFWCGQVLAVIAGLLGIGFVRSAIRKYIAGISERVFDLSLIALLPVGLASLPGRTGDDLATIISLKSEVEGVRDYSDVARLTFNGSGHVGGDILFESALTRIMEGTFQEVTPTRFRRVCTDAAFAKYRQAIRDFPRFPFSHYWLGCASEMQGIPRGSRTRRRLGRSSRERPESLAINPVTTKR